MTGLKIMSNKVKDIENYLDSLFPNPKTELNYNKDYDIPPKERYTSKQ